MAASVSSFLMPLPFSRRYARVSCARNHPPAAASRKSTVDSASLRGAPRPTSSICDSRNLASTSVADARRYQFTASVGLSATPVPLSYIVPSSRCATALPPSASLVHAGAAAAQVAAAASLAQLTVVVATGGGGGPG